jgi:hypothetical protein
VDHRLHRVECVVEEQDKEQDMKLYWFCNALGIVCLVGLLFVGGIPAMLIGTVWALCAYFEGAMLCGKARE